MTVKKLKWTGVGSKVEASALGLKVFYMVEGEPGDWTLISPGEASYVRTPGYQTQRAALNAAQVDFERRVTLELVPNAEELAEAIKKTRPQNT